MILDNTWDLTAVGTLALAVVTALALVVGWLTLRQTKREIAVSRREVEEAHRPVVVPIADSRKMDLASAEVPRRAKPWVDGGVLYVPIENVGPGPALDIEATIALLDSAGAVEEGGEKLVETAAALGTSNRIAVEVKVDGLTNTPDFWLTLMYSDVAQDKKWATAGSYISGRERYEDLAISLQAEGT